MSSRRLSEFCLGVARPSGMGRHRSVLAPGAAFLILIGGAGFGPLPGQDRPAPLLQLETRDPGNGQQGKHKGTLNAFVGARGYGRDVCRMRFSGALPEGVRLRGSTLWGAGEETALVWDTWIGTPKEAKKVDYLGGLRLRLDGPNAHLWRLTYRAHLGYLGDTTWYPAGALLGRQGDHKYRVQGLHLRLEPCPPGPRSWVLEAPVWRAKDGKNRRVRFLVVDLLKGGLDSWSPGAADRKIQADDPFGSRVEGASAPQIASWTLKLGTATHYAVVVFDRPDPVQAPGEFPEAKTLATQLEALLVGLPRGKRRGVLAELGKAPQLVGGRVLGGFTVLASSNRQARSQVQFGNLPTLKGKVRSTPESERIGGSFARRVELREGCTVDLTVLLREG